MYNSFSNKKPQAKETISFPRFTQMAHLKEKLDLHNTNLLTPYPFKTEVERVKSINSKKIININKKNLQIKMS